MTKDYQLVPRPHHRLVTNIEALFLGQLKQASDSSVYPASINVKTLVNQWLIVANFCFLLSFCINFILNY